MYTFGIKNGKTNQQRNKLSRYIYRDGYIIVVISLLTNNNSAKNIEVHPQPPAAKNIIDQQKYCLVTAWVSSFKLNALLEAGESTRK